MKVTSKFSFFNVYLWLSFLLIILVLTLYFICRAMLLHTEFTSNMYAAYGCLIILILLGFAFYQLAKTVAHIVITSDVITIKSLFKKDIIFKADIQNIDLFARKSSGFLSNRNNVNGIFITTKSGGFFFFADLYFRNAPEIKESLYNSFKQLTAQQITYQNIISVNSSISFDLEFERFSGSYLLSANGIIFTCFCIGMVYLAFATHNSNNSFITLSMFYPALVFYLAFGYQSHYFLLSQDQLIIRNQLWRWRCIEYDIKDIQSIVIEKAYRQSNSLRVNTKKFTSRKFPAGSLYNKTWTKLIEKFKSLGIEVNNEIFYIHKFH